MEKGVGSSLFVNDGSFMEKFKQLQQEKQEKGSASEKSKSGVPANSSGTLRPNTNINKRPFESKSNETRKPITSSSGGKLAFSLKQKSKLVAPAVKLSADEDEEDSGNGSGDGPEKRMKLGEPDDPMPSSGQGDVPSPPSDPAVKKVAEKLASFVAKNGRQFEHITRQRNPGDTPFKFLFDIGCADYKYYEYCLIEEEKILQQTKEAQAARTEFDATSFFHFPEFDATSFFIRNDSAVPSVSTSRTSSVSQRSSLQQHSNYQIPASALYEANEDSSSSIISTQEASVGNPPSHDPIAMMEFYMKKAAQEERKRQPKQSKDEMPPPASLQGPVKKGHHMGDYIPQEELEKFLSTCNDAAAQKAAKEAAEKAKIQADNVGHKLLSKMGWKEGEGLGSSKSGRADPVMAGNVKLNNLGVGAEQPGEVTPDDDIYEQYKKRMMLGYRYRPNPLNNPRKAYY